MKKPILSTCLFLIAALLHGQTNPEQFVSGKITGFDGESLIGVSVSIAGKNRGATTDLNGYFNIAVDKEDVLRIAYTGYQTLELYPEEITYELDGHIVLKEGMWLREVVITGQRVELNTHTTICCGTRCCDCFAPVRKAVDEKTSGQAPQACKKWEYFPNPTTDGVTVFTESARGMISVISSDGKLVVSRKVTDVQTRIELTGLATGMYLLNYENEDWAQAIGQVALVRN